MEDTEVRDAMETLQDIERRRDALVSELSRLNVEQERLVKVEAGKKQLGADVYDDGTVLLFTKTFVYDSPVPYTYVTVKRCDMWFVTGRGPRCQISWDQLLEIMFERCETIEVIKMERGEVLL